MNIDPEEIVALASAPATAYRELLYRPNDKVARSICERFALVARPGQRPADWPRPGDVLLRIDLGQPGGGEFIVFAYPDLTRRRFSDEHRTAGWFALVTGAADAPVERRILDPAGRLPHGQLLLRPLAPPVDEEVPDGTALSSSRLQWPGASPAELAFMRAVYDKHVANSIKKGATFTADLPTAVEVEDGHRAGPDAAAAAVALLKDARSALAAQGLADKVRIGIVSAYRPASRQFLIWQGKGRNGGFPYYYRKMLEQGRLAPGDYGAAAIAEMAVEIANWVAAPGYSNHQDGLAFDFGTQAVGKKGLGAIGKKAWFHKWLVAHAHNYGFYPYEKEAWHWTYRGTRQSVPPAAFGQTAAPSPAASPSTATVGPLRAGETTVDHVPLLATHRGGGPDMLLRWNDISTVPGELDVVVHLHGFGYAGMQLATAAKRIGGFNPGTGTVGQVRQRPTLMVIPKGDDTGIKQENGPFNIFRFPALVTRNGLNDLIRAALDRFAAEIHGAPPRLGRLILTAHSGGGTALLQILTYHNPHEVHVFDALYQNASALSAWASRRIDVDRVAIEGMSDKAAKEYMSSRGGALRVFYQDRIARGTKPHSRALRAELVPLLTPALEPWYRIEASKYDHFQIPRRYGWRILANASADVPDAYTEAVVVGTQPRGRGRAADSDQEIDENAYEADDFRDDGQVEEDVDPVIRSTAQLQKAWSQYECAEQQMVSLRLFGKWTTPVNPLAVDAWRALEQALASMGYPVHRAWVYECRNIKDKAARSLHAYGLAIDIDHSGPTCNVNRPTPDRRAVRFSTAATKEQRCRDVQRDIADTSFTPEQVAAVEAIRTVDGHQVFAWGGRWSTTKDTMHFQINVTPDELARGIAPRRDRPGPEDLPKSPRRPAPVEPCDVRKLRVAVVGGGLAGLMAARTLARKGVKVTVFEAREEVGGRVFSDRSFAKGRITEFGAELIGSIHTTWCQLAIEYEIGLISRMNTDLYRGQQLNERRTLDKALSMDEIRNIDEEKETKVLRPIAELAKKTISDPARPWDEKDPARKAELVKFDNLSVAHALEDIFKVARGSRLWKAMELLLVNNQVAPLEEQNFLGLLCLVRGGQHGTINTRPLMGYWDELEIYRCADGAQRLAFELAKDVRDHNGKVALQRAVTDIDLGEVVTVHSRSTKRSGGTLQPPPLPIPTYFDYVIFAVPPSVWRKVTVTPTHPKDHVGLMGTGDAVKFFTRTKDRFWLKDRSAPYGGSLTLGQVWEGTENQTRPNDEELVLSAFAGARSPTPQTFKDELAKLFRHYPKNAPTGIANWPKEPFIETGYVSPKVGQILKIGKGLNEVFRDRMFFAGEHTQMDHFGYMEGALRSGQRVADELIAHACAPGPQVLLAAAARQG
jgi:monoamine oxidase